MACLEEGETVFWFGLISVTAMSSIGWKSTRQQGSNGSQWRQSVSDL